MPAHTVKELRAILPRIDRDIAALRAQRARWERVIADTEAQPASVPECSACGRPGDYIVKMPGEEPKAFCARHTDWRPGDGVADGGEDE